MAGRKNTPRRACRGVWRTQRIARRASRPTTSTTKRSCYSTRPSSLCSSCCTLTLLNGARRGRSSSAVFAAASIEIAYLNGERSARERPSTLFASGTTARSLSQVSSRATPLRFGDGIVNIKASGENVAFQPGGTGGLKLTTLSAPIQARCRVRQRCRHQPIYRPHQYRLQRQRAHVVQRQRH